MSLIYSGQSKLSTTEISSINTDIVLIEQDAKTKVTTTQLNTNSTLFEKFLTDFFSTYKITRNDGYIMKPSDYVSFYNELDNTFDITSDYATSYSGAMTQQFNESLLTLQNNLTALINSSRVRGVPLISTGNISASDTYLYSWAPITSVGLNPEDYNFPCLFYSFANGSADPNNTRGGGDITLRTRYDIASKYFYNVFTNCLNVPKLLLGVGSSAIDVGTDIFDLKTAVSTLQSNPVAQPVDLTPINTQISSINTAISTLQNTTPNKIIMGDIASDRDTLNSHNSLSGLPANTYRCPIFRPVNATGSSKDIAFFGDNSGATINYNYNVYDAMLNVPNLKVGSVNVGTTLTSIQNKQTTDDVKITTNTSNIASLNTKVAPYTSGLNPYHNSKNFIIINAPSTSGQSTIVNFGDMTTNFKYLNQLGVKTIHVKLIGSGGGGGNTVAPYQAGSGGGAGGYYEGVISIEGMLYSHLQIYVGSGGTITNKGGDTFIRYSPTNPNQQYDIINAQGGNGGSMQPDTIQYALGGAGGAVVSYLSSYASSYTDIISSSGNVGGTTMCATISAQQYPTGGSGGSGSFGSVGAGGRGYDPLHAGSYGKGGIAIISW